MDAFASDFLHNNQIEFNKNKDGSLLLWLTFNRID
jgi:hypothetical protein